MTYPGFPTELIGSICCQFDGGRLQSGHDPEVKAIFNGKLVCIECGASYLILDGIARMLDIEKLPVSAIVEKEERDKEAPFYDSRLSTRHGKEVLSVLKKIKLTTGQRAIEYAAGTGRFTLPLASCGVSVLAVDFSLSSLEMMRDKITSEQIIGLIQADASNFVTTPESFDLGIAMQFVEHIPNRKDRIGFYASVAASIKSDGLFFISAYHHDLRRRIHKEGQEGRHSNGIFFHYFTRKEFRIELREVFQEVSTHLIDITLPFEARIGMPKSITGALSRICESIYGVNLFGHLIFARCRKHL